MVRRIMIIMEGQGVGGHVGDDCVLFFFFSRWSQMVLTECDSECQSGEKYKTSADKRQEKPWSALTSLLFHLLFFLCRCVMCLELKRFIRQGE